MVHFRAFLVLSLCAVGFILADARVYGADQIKFGLKSGVGVSSEQTERTSLGVFMNYTVSPKMSFDLEFRNSVLPSGSNLQSAEDISVFESLTKKDWSTRIALNFFLKKCDRNFSPFMGIGVGNYYSSVSKRRIKSAGADIREDNIDYDLRKLLRRPGFFATLGMQCYATRRMIFYMQAKSTVLFRSVKSLPVEMEIGFSDFINISTGLRFNFN